MYMNHVGIVCSSESHCDRFYQSLLGLEKLPAKHLSADLAKQLFNLEQDFPMLYYANAKLKFEIFITDRKDHVENRIGHVCIEVDNLAQFLTSCQTHEVEVIRVPKGEGLVILVKDYDGNLFEIKEHVQ